MLKKEVKSYIFFQKYLWKINFLEQGKNENDSFTSQLWGIQYKFTQVNVNTCIFYNFSNNKKVGQIQLQIKK